MILQFLTELTRLFQKCRTSGSVVLTLKKYDGRTKPVPRKGHSESFEPADNKCLLRASDGKRKISTVVSTKEVIKFQMAYSNLLRAHIDGLKKKDKKSKGKKTKATQWGWAIDGYIPRWCQALPVPFCLSVHLSVLQGDSTAFAHPPANVCPLDLACVNTALHPPPLLPNSSKPLPSSRPSRGPFHPRLELRALGNRMSLWSRVTFPRQKGCLTYSSAALHLPMSSGGLGIAWAGDGEPFPCFDGPPRHPPGPPQLWLRLFKGGFKLFSVFNPISGGNSTVGQWEWGDRGTWLRAGSRMYH